MVESYIRKLATDENESTQVSVVPPGALVVASCGEDIIITLDIGKMYITCLH